MNRTVAVVFGMAGILATLLCGPAFCEEHPSETRYRRAENSRSEVSPDWRDAVLALSLAANLIMVLRTFRNRFPDWETCETIPDHLEENRRISL